MYQFFRRRVQVSLISVDEIKDEIFLSDKKVINILCFLKVCKKNFEVANKVELSKNYCLYLEWNVDEYPEKTQVILNKVCTKAILTDYSQISSRNDKLEKYVNINDTIRIISKSGTDITFKIGSKANKENCDMLSEKIIQLPGGEVFWLPKAGSCNGVLKNSYVSATVQNDMIRDISGEETKELSPICEFGLGTNSNVKAINGLAFSEKAWLTCKNEAVQRWYEQLPEAHWLKQDSDDIFNTSDFTRFFMEILQVGVGTYLSGMELQALLLQEHESKVINFIGKTLETIEGREAGKYALIYAYSGKKVGKINIQVASSVVVAFYYDNMELMLDFSEEEFFMEIEPQLNDKGISLANRIVYSYIDNPEIVSFYNGKLTGLNKGKTTLHLFYNGRHFKYDIRVSG